MAGPGVFGPVKDEARAIQVLRDAVASGVNHIDTSDFYGPHETNKLIKKALHPYADNLCIVTKVGARRDEKGGWLTAFTPQELVSAVEDNLCNLGLEVMEVVNLRSMLDIHQPKEGSLEPQLEAMIKLKERGLVRHIGLSNVTVKQVEDAQKLTPIACVPFFPLGGFSPLQSTQLDEIAADLQATPMQVALAWLLRRSPNILLIPGTSSPEHLQENLASARLNLSDEVMEKLNGMN
ncbi:aryl-alcohol dehydrogenase-like predicted oxidoreductase [Buttiauxella sp. BIGb0552]|uniref:aldo/keto reductase n=1 Tax=Buttiauxella sp. BIGb0552 TaxID=2485120 RepID=UPI001064B3F6|nr:aldo/keto reductase [Buttiauxella sp. BIGb0552]TDX20727.1 aryl-alcohol dehydrogenase-like predicted oxidoreductase [Buttiauxella sp. BIGb0552]